MAKGTTFNLVRVVTRGEGQNAKKFFNPVGKVILHESGETGTVFLHMFDGDFAIFKQDPKKKGSAPDAGDAIEQ